MRIFVMSSEKVPSEMCKMCRFRSSSACIKSHPGICSLQYSMIMFTDKEGLDQHDCAGCFVSSLSAYVLRDFYAWLGPNLPVKIITF